VIGCDPGFTVRQVSLRPDRYPAVPETPQRVTVQVLQFHALIGVSYYEPAIRITNNTSSLIKIRGVELMTRQGVYQSSSGKQTDWLTDVDSGATADLKVSFKLNAGLSTTFKEAAELRVRYTIGDTSQTARARLLGRVKSAD
jgi:hypothetical protein